MLNRLSFLLLTLIGVISVHSSSISIEDDDITITPKGYGSFEVGQIGHGYFRKELDQFAEEIHHIWQQRCFTNLGFSVQYKEHLTLDFVGEGLLAFSTPQKGLYPTTMQPRTFFYIKSSNALLTFGNEESFQYGVQAGYFPYKYNKDVRNLGEYLFRTLPYPLVFFNDFDYAEATLLGLRFNVTLFNRMISNDVILNSETIGHPVQNYSLSDVFDFNFRDVVSIGGGLSFYQCFSVYQGKNIGGSVDRYYYLKNVPQEEIETLGLDTAIEWSAVKIMGRVNFDPKKFFSFDILGENDLKLYYEINQIGTKNFEGIYDKASDRLVQSFGFNLPGLKYVDLINVEFEYCTNNTDMSDALFYTDYPTLRPVPMSSVSGDEKLKRSPWRWSVYVKKTLFNEHFNITAQVARDHKKLNFYYFERAFMSFGETLPTCKDWWWALKTEYKF